MAIRHFPASLGGIDHRRADTAIDIDFRIGQRRAGMARERVKRVLALTEIERQRLEHLRPLMEGHGPKRRPATFAGEVAHGGKVEIGLAEPGDNPTVDGGRQIHRFPRAPAPAA